MTDNYFDLKSLVLGQDFPWFHVSHALVGRYSQGQTNVNNFSFFSHVFLDRPGDTTSYSYPKSSLLPLAEKVFLDICEEKKISPHVLYRVNANLTFPSSSKNTDPSPLHRDHAFPHSNMIVYLTDCNGGPTMVHGQDDYYGKEDDVYIFEGLHQHKLPTSNKRVVLVYTFL
tara:strand:+ start:129 stop:641 length:513 start_codon:yes stop_codon:yes gene_type:complete